MEIEQVIQKRFSCRSFSVSQSVPDELIEKIILLSQRAPSAGNLQAFRVVIVKNKEIHQKLARAALDQTFLARAPVVLVISAAPTLSLRKYGERGRILYSTQDATIFAAYCELICANFGLASIWIGAFSEEKVVNILKNLVPQHFIEKPVALIGIGYPAKEISRFTNRININELVYSLD